MADCVIFYLSRLEAEMVRKKWPVHGSGFFFAIGELDIPPELL